MLVVAVLMICIAHYIRTVRWELFVKTYEKPDRGNLIRSLSAGYFINFFVPFKAGDLVRAWMAGRKMKNGRGFSLATVIVDRYLDIVVVGVVFIFLPLLGIDSGSGSAAFYIVSACVLLVLSMAAYSAKGMVKRILKSFAGIFSPKIEVRILRFCWSLIWSFKDIFGKINKAALLGATLGMWLFYFVSYYCFASFIGGKSQGVGWADIFNMLFTGNSIKESNIVFVSAGAGFLSGQTGWLAIYLLASAAVLFVISFLCGKGDGSTQNSGDACLNLIPHMDEKERLRFLEAYFSDDRRDYIENYLKINQGVLILRDYSAGSNASTMLCMHEGKNFFRKYAFGDDGEKLYQQVEWLKKFQDEIPLPKVIQYQKEDGFCCYDMPYQSSAVGLFEYSHSMPKERAWGLIKGAVECLEHTLYQVNLRKADKDTIYEYIRLKVDKNLKQVMGAKYMKELMSCDEVIINGVSYKNLPYYLEYLERKHLYEVFKEDKYSEIHGDLTVENIICTRGFDGGDGFYIIDPNTGNIHDSSNLDYAKLLQSIHGGYEFLMATKNVQVEGNRINFMFTKSEAYTYLYGALDRYMCRNFPEERIRSIYYHEIVHWLRLMPYKIEKNGKRALLFYAGMLMVMDDVIKRFERGMAYEDKNGAV